jgi:hypothetical protein
MEFHHHSSTKIELLKLFFNLVSVKVYDKVTGNLNLSLCCRLHHKLPIAQFTVAAPALNKSPVPAHRQT